MASIFPNHGELHKPNVLWRGEPRFPSNPSSGGNMAPFLGVPLRAPLGGFAEFFGSRFQNA